MKYVKPILKKKSLNIESRICAASEKGTINATDIKTNEDQYSKGNNFDIWDDENEE